MCASERNIPLGAVIGGSIGGAAVILALLGIWKCARRRRALDSWRRFGTTSQIKQPILAGEGLSSGNAYDVTSGAFLSHEAGHNPAQMNFVAHPVPVMGHLSWTGPESPTLPLPNVQNSTCASVVGTQPPFDDTLEANHSSLPCTGPEFPTRPSSNIQPNPTSPLPVRTLPALDNTPGSLSTVEDGPLLKKLDDLCQSVAEIASTVDAMRAETANMAESTVCRDPDRYPDPDPDGHPPSYGRN
jgi:hypothetical protein